MLATDGHFTFVASRPQLACATFIIAEPSEVISLELSDVSIDCSAGDFIKVSNTYQNRPPRTIGHTTWSRSRRGDLDQGCQTGIRCQIDERRGERRLILKKIFGLLTNVCWL